MTYTHSTMYICLVHYSCMPRRYTRPSSHYASRRHRYRGTPARMAGPWRDRLRLEKSCCNVILYRYDMV